MYLIKIEFIINTIINKPNIETRETKLKIRLFICTTIFYYVSKALINMGRKAIIFNN